MVSGLVLPDFLNFLCSLLSQYTFSSKVVWHMPFICNLEHSVKVSFDSVRIFLIFFYQNSSLSLRLHPLIPMGMCDIELSCLSIRKVDCIVEERERGRLGLLYLSAPR